MSVIACGAYLNNQSKMNKIQSIFSIIFNLTFLVFLSVPTFIYGAPITGDRGATIENPIKADSFPEFIRNILEIVVQIGAPIIVLGVIFSGFLFVRAQGNSDKLKIAKEAFLYTLIGAAIVLGAFVITEAIQGTVDQLR